MCGGKVGFGTAFGSLGFNRRERGVLPAYRQLLFGHKYCKFTRWN